MAFLEREFSKPSMSSLLMSVVSWCRKRSWGLLSMPNSSASSKRMKTIKGTYLKELDYQLFIFRYSDF